jgi:hypothetical protein
LRAIDTHTVRTDNPDSFPAGHFRQLRFQLYSVFLAGLTEARRTEVNRSYPLFGTFFYKPGSNMGIHQADYVVDVTGDIFKAGIDLVTFDLPSFGIDEIERAVESNFEKALQESERPVPGLGSCNANKGERIRVEEEIQVMLTHILRTP